MRKEGSSNATKTKRLSKVEIKKQLANSLINNEKVETEELNKQAQKVENSENAANIIKEYEDIARTKKENILYFAYHQREVCQIERNIYQAG